MNTIKNIQIADNNCLVIEFSDGKTKSVDLTSFLEKGIFSQLKDPGYFRLVKNNGYFITWPNNQELSADMLYYC